MPRSMTCVAAAIAQVLLLAICVGTAHAQGGPASPVAAMEEAVAAEPDDGVLRLFLAYVRARAGDTRGALHALEEALPRSNGLLPGAEFFPALKDLPAFHEVRRSFLRALPRVVTGRVTTTLRDPLLLPEGIAYDPVERAFYVGSLARRAIYRVGPRGTLVPLSQPGDRLDAVLGIAIDPGARKLYAITTSALTLAGRSAPRNALKVYDLARRRLERTYEVPEARQLNDVAIGDGFALLTDSAGGGVWRVALAQGAVDALVPLGRARGANGIAISGARAYVAANRRPLAIDLATGELTPLRLPPREQAAAIDGLYWHDGALIGVQNVTTPGRVVRMLLAEDGTTVSRFDTLQSHHQPAFDQPTTAAPTPDALYVLTRTSVTRLREDGTIEAPATIEPARLLRIPWPSGTRPGGNDVSGRGHL